MKTEKRSSAVRRFYGAGQYPNWKWIALCFAIDAYENHFQYRKGIWFIKDVDALCVYNNNPYAADPEMRDRETAKFRAAMKKAGIKVLAYATYPPEGEEDAGYTYAMILDARQDKRDFVQATMHAIVTESLLKMSAT